MIKKFPKKGENKAPVNVKPSGKVKPSAKLPAKDTPAKKPKASIPVAVRSTLKSAGIEVNNIDNLDAKSLTRVLSAVDQLSTLIKEKLVDLKGSGTAKTVNKTVTGKASKKQTIAQFVAPSKELRKVYREAGLSETKDSFKANLAKAKEFGVALSMFNKSIFVDDQELLVYGVSVRGGVCRLICKNAKGKDVRVESDTVISF